MRASLFSITLASVTALGFASPSLAQESADQKLGTVHFETSCNETAQRRFDRAMRYQHSFWYTASKEIYEETLKADPACAIAYWGIALSYLNNPHSPIPAPNLPLGLAAIEKAKAAGAKTERERDYIDALSVMYVDYEKTPHQARVQSYLKAMEALAGHYPADDEAQIFYAIALNVAAAPSDKTYANQLKGAAILGPILERQPQHPGVAHYLIHLYDYPPIAAKGLPPALLYSKIAPNAPHAQHMPSHIFTRVGYWKDSIAANQASVQAAKGSKELGDQMHGQDYMVYAYLQLGQDKEALGVVSEIEALRPDADAFAAAFSQAAAPARYMVERGDWSGAANLEVRPSKFPHVMAITHFARAVGAARTGKIDAAKADSAKLAELRDRLQEAKNGYWAGQVDVQEKVATAWILYAGGNYDEALKAMSAAVDAEDNTEKSPVTPGPLAPARELYGAMLLDRGMAKEALAVFEATMAKEPNRYNGYVGAAMAAQAAGDAAKAKATYGKLIALAAESSSERPTLAAARSFVASN
jgi:tetratricopeptide (TPR) repeat protein